MYRSLPVLVNMQLTIESERVRMQIRKSHLALNKRECEETNNILERLIDMETYIDGRIADIIKTHPAYAWFSQVKGIGNENIGKIIGLIRVAPQKDDSGNDLPFANSISALWKYAGYAPVNGKSMKKTAGQKLQYNATLRTMCWRTGSSLLRANGKFYAYYCEQKERYTQRMSNTGVSIVPASKLPVVRTEGMKARKAETDSVISEGHVHNYALRKMIKLFLACLWLEWREGEGLPVTKPYAIDILQHDSFIKPKDMIDKKLKTKTSVVKKTKGGK